MLVVLELVLVLSVGLTEQYIVNKLPTLPIVTYIIDTHLTHDQVNQPPN